MHRILGRSSGQVAEVQFGRSMDAADLASLGPELEALIERHDKSRLLWDLSELREGDASLLFEEGILRVPHADRVDRIALVVGADGPERIPADASRVPPFADADLKVFAAEGRSAAMDWLVA